MLRVIPQSKSQRPSSTESKPAQTRSYRSHRRFRCSTQLIPLWKRKNMDPWATLPLNGSPDLSKVLTGWTRLLGLLEGIVTSSMRNNQLQAATPSIRLSSRVLTHYRLSYSGVAPKLALVRLFQSFPSFFRALILRPLQHRTATETRSVR